MFQQLAPNWLQTGRQFWQGGQYALAVRAFEHAAVGGDEGAAIAWLRALLALGRLVEAKDVARRQHQRLPGSATLAGYRALLAHASGDYEMAAQRVSRLPVHPFCTAVHIALSRALGLPPVAQATPTGPWRHVLAEGAYLAGQGQINWLAFPAQLITEALRLAETSGLCIECGVYYGRSIAMLAVGRERVFGLDSFQGLPEAWSPKEPAGTYTTGGRLPEVPANVTLIPGWFSDTLPAFCARHAGPVDLLHVDCDLYSSTVTVLDHLGDRLQPGALILFDDYLGYPGWRDHEYRAWQEYCRDTGTRYRYVCACMLGREVLVEVLAN